MSGFVAGKLDILAAIIVYAVIQQKTTAEKFLQYIASAVLGKEAYSGGWQMAFYGLVFHFMIALLFACFYFLLYPYTKFLNKQKVAAGLLYGFFVWIIMNLVVLPVSFPGMPPVQWDWQMIQSTIILMLFVGLPVSFITGRHYKFD